MKKVCVVVGSRANYSSIKSTMQAVKDHPNLQLQVIVMASALLERYGAVVELIKKDGFEVDAQLHMHIEGETPKTMAKSVGLGLIEIPTVLESLAPDFVVTVGDRFETLSTAISAALMNIKLVHTMGGEVTGTIDESVRHAVTKLAHIHFTASEDAKERVLKLGELTSSVFNVGCPRMDLVADVLNKSDDMVDFSSLALGVGDKLNINEPFLLVSQHPVTTEYGQGELHIMQTLQAVRNIGLPTIVLWPNADAGGDSISKGIRKWREHGKAEHMHFYKNLPIEVYIKLMQKTACLIGNSSSGIREGAFIGTPVVNIGSRQDNRESGENVAWVGYDMGEIETAVRKQMEHGPYASNPIYGNGTAGTQIADILSDIDVPVQKAIAY